MKRITFLIPLLLLATAAPGESGLIKKPSGIGVQATLDRLEDSVRKKGFTVFARIDHAAGAAKAGQSLRPTQVLIFGNPKIGTALLSSQQSIGLDLPIRVAAWETEDGQTWIGYNDPEYLVHRHQIGDRAEIVKNMRGALQALTDAAANP